MSQTPKIQLLYFPGCPNVGETRAALRKALANLALEHLAVEEIDIHAPGAPERARNRPSPSILVDGNDIEGHDANDAAACRIYDGRGGVPRVEKIEAFIRTTLAARRQEDV